MKKILLSVLICTGLLSVQTQTLDIRDEFGRTPLVNFVMAKELEICAETMILEKLWDQYFHKEPVQDGYFYTSQGYPIPRYKYIPIRKIYTTDADVAMYCQQEQQLINLIDDAVKKIAFIVRAGIDINAKDDEGKTVLNYCYTVKIYEELIRLGADFQYGVWIYFNPGRTVLAALGVVSIGALGVAGYNHWYGDV